jgi:hypothetical protein
MRRLLSQWGVALTLIGSVFVSSFALADIKGDCSQNQGICGCSYGRVLCCDGSYAPKHYSTKDGKFVQNSCMSPAHATGLGQQLGTSFPAYRAPSNTGHYPAPSQEIYWRGSIFDR